MTDVSHQHLITQNQQTSDFLSHFRVSDHSHAAQVNNDLVKHLVHTSPFTQTCLTALPLFPWLLWLGSLPLMLSMLINWRNLAKRWMAHKDANAR
jgi:hypothetical protein